MTVLRRRTLRWAVGLLAAAVVLAPVAWWWSASLMPDRYSVMTMGYDDYGGGPRSAPGAVGAHHTGHTGAGGGAVDISTLVADPARRADVRVRLVARQQRFELASGRAVEGYTLNGRSPGPTIHAVQGQLIEVRLSNESVADGVTLHWHGVNVPNAMDGVAGVTQDAVREGETYTYRFVAGQAGTYWYHSHQISHEQVKKGLLGALVIAPRHAGRPRVDVPALVHMYDGRRTVNGRDDGLRARAGPGDVVRVRVINTDNGPMPVWVDGASFRVVSVDGTDVNRPTPVRNRAVLVTAGGRVDLEVRMPPDGSGVRAELGGDTAVEFGPGRARSEQPGAFVDLLAYGTPAPIGFDPERADRRFVYDIGRRPGFLDGRPGLWWTINGRMFPDVPMFMVAEGDVVRVRISNHSGDVHPMHLHGHHAVVLSRNGVSATGSPWWVDSLNVEDGEAYEIAFLADNPGVWMDHCHNLPHATQGLVSHLMYLNVTTPYVVGGPAGNEPE